MTLTPQNKVKIVLVDDELIVRHQLKIILKGINADLIFFASAQEALNYLLENNDVAMLVTDWLMPDMDGPELITKVRALAQHKYLYIMLLTNLREKESLVLGIEVGADDFLHKPIVPEEIFAKISAGIRLQALKNELKERNERLSEALTHIKEDLQAAAQLNATILPKDSLAVDSIKMSVLHEPCEYVGGDLYGYKKITNDSFAFFQIDVAGHGIPSALLSFSLGHELSKAQLFSDTIIECDLVGIKPQVLNVERAVTAINKNSFHISSDMYFTMTYGVLNVETGLLKYCQAGHPPLILFSDETGEAETHGEGGFPVGIMIDADYEEQELYMQKNDRLFVFSDGIPEAENQQGEFFGEVRLCRLIEEGKELTIKDLLNRIYQQVLDWSEDKKLGDDITIIGFQWTG